MLFVILPAASGSLGLSKVVEPLLPPGSECHAVDLLGGECAQQHSGFRIGGLGAIADHIIQRTPSLADGRDDIILVSACAGCLITLEIARRMPCPPRRVVLLDPIAIPFATTRSFLEFHRENLAFTLRLYRRYRKMCKEISRAPKFARYALHMKIRSLWYYRWRSSCRLTVLVARERERIRNSFFARNLAPDFHSAGLSHKEMFYTARGIGQIRLVLEKALQSSRIEQGSG